MVFERNPEMLVCYHLVSGQCLGILLSQNGIGIDDILFDGIQNCFGSDRMQSDAIQNCFVLDCMPFDGIQNRTNTYSM